MGNGLTTAHSPDLRLFSRRSARSVGPRYARIADAGTFSVLQSVEQRLPGRSGRHHLLLARACRADAHGSEERLDRKRQRRRLRSRENRAGAGVVDRREHVVVLPRAVDVGVPEDLRLEAVDDAVVMQVLLDRELGATVGRDGIGRMVLARRTPSLRLPVERAAGTPSIATASTSDTRSTARLEELQRSEDVGARVVQGIGDTVTQIDLRGVVRDELDLLFAKKRLEVCLRDVGLDEPGLLRDLLPAPGGQVVNDDHAMAVFQMPLRHVRPDESRAPGHENVHNSDHA